MGGILQAFAGMSVEEYASSRRRVPARRPHPTLEPQLPRVRLPADDRAAALPRGQRLHELHRLRRRPRLHAAGDRGDLRHPGRARDRQLERAALHDDEHGGTVAYLAEPDFFDDGPVKPVRIWSRIGRRPILAGGNSNGDIPMLRYAGGTDRPALRLLVLPRRRRARVRLHGRRRDRRSSGRRADGWTVVSMQERLGDRLPGVTHARARRAPAGTRGLLDQCPSSSAIALHKAVAFELFQPGEHRIPPQPSVERFGVTHDRSEVLGGRILGSHGVGGRGGHRSATTARPGPLGGVGRSRCPLRRIPRRTRRSRPLPATIVP